MPMTTYQPRLASYRPLRLLSLLLLLSIASCAEPPAPPAADLAISNVTVIDSVNGVRPNMHVLIKGDEIIKVEPAGTQAPDARTTIDGRDRFLIPGLWDMHVHITYEPELTAAMPELFLDYGITSVRDTGGMLPQLLPQIRRWRSGEIQAPRIFFSGPLLDGSKVVYDGHDRPQIGVANASPRQAIAQVEELVNAGADFIKIYELVSPPVFNALVQVAEQYNLPIAAHVPLALLADQAGAAVDSMEHLRNIELACADDAQELLIRRREILDEPGGVSGHALRSQLHEEFRALAFATARPDSQRCQQVLAALHNTIQVPTLRLNTITTHSPLDRAGWREELGRLPSAVAQRWLQTAQNFYGKAPQVSLDLAQWSLDLVGSMHAASVPIGAGTDTPIGQAIPGYSLHTELERLVEAGLTPLQALHSATIRPAEFFGLQNSYGQIEAGMVADLVLLRADPTRNITSTRQIESVIAQGQQVR